MWRLQERHEDLSMANYRIDKLEQELNSTERNLNQPSQQASGSVEQATSLMALEEEKAEREKRSRNVIITGLHPKADCFDWYGLLTNTSDVEE